jgi:transcriptional regulator with XRE-family HTH domain
MSLRSYATRVGVSAAYLSDVYSGKRNPGPAILKFLGLEVRIRTERKYSYSRKRAK